LKLSLKLSLKYNHTHSVFSDKYHNARKACKLAEDDSNLDTAAGETDLERPRKKRKTKRLYDSEESNDEPPQVMKKKSNRIINSDSDEDEKSNAQKLKDTIRTLIQQKRNSPVYQHRTSSLPLKHSSKNTIVELTKPSTSTDLSCSRTYPIIYNLEPNCNLFFY